MILSNDIDIAVSLWDVRKRVGRREVFAGLSADFRIGELCVIRGARGAGKTTLARLIAGQIHPDEGEIRRDRLAAPSLGAGHGFMKSAPALRTLDLRATAYGLDTRAYVRAIATLMDRPEALREPFERLKGPDRTVVVQASVWLLPASVFVADGRLLPTENKVRERLGPLFTAARERAAVVLVADLAAPTSAYRPERAYRIEHGRLVPEPPSEG